MHLSWLSGSGPLTDQSTCPPTAHTPVCIGETPNPVSGMLLCLVLTLNVEGSKPAFAQPPIDETVQIAINPCKLTLLNFLGRFGVAVPAALPCIGTLCKHRFGSAF